MKKIRSILFTMLTIFSAALYYISTTEYNRLINHLFPQSEEIGMVVLGCLQAIFLVLTALLVTTAFAKLQYHITYKNALLYQFKRYAIAFMALPPYVLCFITIYPLSEYAVLPEYTNPLYLPELFEWCYTWGSVLMVITLLLWVGVLAMNLFGSVQYGYYGINLLAAIGLAATLYVSTDIFAMGTWCSTTFVVFNILYELICIVLIFLLRRNNIHPTPRPFFAQADEDDLFWRKKAERQRNQRF